MANDEEREKTARGLMVGGVAGTLLGVLVAAIAQLLAAKPAEAAPPDEKLNYLIDCLTTLLPVLAQVAENNARLIALLEQWLAAQGILPAEGVEPTILTPWVAKEAEQIYSFAIRTAGTFYSNKMIDWTKGKRLLIKVESTLDQACQIQPIGNYVDDMNLATDINAPLPLAPNGNKSIVPAWDDWHPFVGVRITTAVAPTAGMLNLWSVIQE